MLKLEKSSFKIDVFGEVIDIRKPNWSEIEQFQEKILDKDGNELSSLVRTRELLIKIGLSESQAAALEIDHVTAIMDLIIPKKKD